MEDLKEFIISIIFNKLKIDAIITISEQYSWADGDEDGRISGGVDYFLNIDKARKKRNRLIEQILREFNYPETPKYIFSNNIKFSKVYQLQQIEKQIKETDFLGINGKNKTTEPISEKLDKNIKNLLPEKIYNFLIAKCLVDESHKNILNTNALDLILDYWENNLPEPDENDCWTGDGNSEFFWEVLFKENNNIIALGSENECLLKYDFWKVFEENKNKLLPIGY